jgi:RNA polymerase sigma-70 factor (ECF subfamily)
VSVHPAESDVSLAARLRAGEPAALDELFRRHAPGLLRLAAALTGADADGEDVVQDVFVGLPLALRGYEERGAFAAWLRGITARTALAARRRAARRRETALDAGGDRATRAAEPGERLALRDAVRRLPDDQRAVFVLKMVEGYSHAEIAELLGIRSGTSEVRLFTVRRLRSLLSETP